MLPRRPLVPPGHRRRPRGVLRPERRRAHHRCTSSTTTSSDRNGAILDADIELNAVELRHRGRRRDHPRRRAAPPSLEHLHPRGRPPDRPRPHLLRRRRPPDGRPGHPAAQLQPGDALSAAQRDATMYNFQDCGETQKATPEQDDVDGVCGIYPVGDDPGECSTPELDDKGCCAVAGCQAARSPAGTLSVLALAFAALLALRRRRRHGTELVAEAVDREDVARVLLVLFELPAQLDDEVVDGAVGRRRPGRPRPSRAARRARPAPRRARAGA